MVFMESQELLRLEKAVLTDKYYVGICCRAVKFVAILLVALLSFIPAIRAQDISTPAGSRVEQSSESRQGWVNTATGIYHYPGTRWYGNTKQGKFMSEADARAHGYRPAMNGQ
jgi:hypothetical protein